MGWSFTNSNEAWYSNVIDTNDLLINFDSDEGIFADFRITWIELGNKLYPRLEIFDDGWKALYKYGQKFLKVLSKYDGMAVSKNKLMEELKLIGFVDTTPYKSPYDKE